jgi:hypothetical protein
MPASARGDEIAAVIPLARRRRARRASRRDAWLAALAAAAVAALLLALARPFDVRDGAGDDAAPPVLAD